MTNYKCNTCDHIFDEPYQVEHCESYPIPFGNGFATELQHYGVCPECGSEDYEEGCFEEDE